MKILILGSNGYLGHDLAEFLSKNPSFDVVSWSRVNCDLTFGKEMECKLISESPDIIVNCVAYNNIEKCENNFYEQERAINKNVLLVDRLVMYCVKKHCKLIHFSANMVFAGNEEYYSETSEKGPINFFGFTKAVGEEIIDKGWKEGLQACVIRTANIFDKRKTELEKMCFFEAIEAQVNNKGYVDVIDDEITNFTYKRELITMIQRIIVENRFDGVYHLVNKNAVSFYEAAKLYFETLGKTVDIRPVSAKLFNRVAKRPNRTNLLTNTELVMSDLREAMQEYCKA